MLSLFPRDVLDEIWGLTESVSEGFLTYLFSENKHAKCFPSKVLNTFIRKLKSLLFYHRRTDCNFVNRKHAFDSKTSISKKK